MEPENVPAKRRRRELTSNQRAMIVGMSRGGMATLAIAREMQVSARTIQRTVKRWETDGTLTSKPRSGSPKKLTQQDVDGLVALVKEKPFLTYKQVIETSGFNVAPQTVRRALGEHGYAKWRAKRRPLLKEKHALLRLAWATARTEWTPEQWASVIWTDETSVEIGKGKRQQYCFRLSTAADKWRPEYIQPYKKSGGVSVMAWAAIYGNVKSTLYFLERDFEAKKMGYSAKSYLKVLEDNVFEVWKPGMTFMQDNAPIHTAKAVKKWFEDHQIELMLWPPYSPDLNPIEHVWSLLKHKLYQLHPDIEDIAGGLETVRTILKASRH
jgi:transposase